MQGVVYETNFTFITYKDAEILTTLVKKPDIGASREDLKYIQTVGLKEGVEKTIDWMKKYYGK